MPKQQKKSTKTVTQVVTKVNNKPRKANKPRRQRRTTDPESSRVSKLARMIRDPCNADLVQGAYGNEAGILSRYRTTFKLQETQTNGFLLWCPSYVGSDYGDFKSMNTFFYAADNADTRPTNTVDDPLGSGVVGKTGAFRTGASPFVYSDVCQDFRTISACLRMVYTGTTSDCKGRIAILDNIPAGLLINQRPSVNALLSMAKETSRTSLETMEVPFRPSEESEAFKDETAVLYQAYDDAATTMSDYAKTNQATMIGFVWTGIPCDQFDFDFLQNIEWRPQPYEGYVEASSVQISDVPLYKKALKLLDNTMPGWQSAASHYANKAASMAVNYVLGGPPQRQSIKASNRLRITM